MKGIISLVICLVVAAQGQQQYNRVDPRNAKILQEARYLQGGMHGAAYVTDDGTEFKEETDADGTRKGSYSYIDDKGMKITVQYTAGKNGFMVTGDHLPKAPQPLPVPAPPQQPQQQYRPEPPVQFSQYNTNPQYNPQPPQQQQQPIGQFAYGFGEQPQQLQPQPQQQQQQQQQFASFNFNNGVNSHFMQFPQFGQQQQYQQQPPPTPLPSPHRFQAPGKLNLNRTPDGFQYSFTSS